MEIERWLKTGSQCDIERFHPEQTGGEKAVIDFVRESVQKRDGVSSNCQPVSIQRQSNRIVTLIHLLQQ